MACCMVYWGNHHERFRKIFSKYGAVVPLDELQKQSHVHHDDVKAKCLKADFCRRFQNQTVGIPAMKPRETNK